MEHRRRRDVQRGGDRALTGRRALGWGLGLLAVVVLVGLVQLAWAGLQLRAAASEVSRAQQAVAEGDTDAAWDRVEAANSHADRAGWGTTGPHLAAAEWTPYLGDDVAAIRTMVGVIEDLTGPVAEDLFTVQQVLDPDAIKPQDGRIDVRRIASARQPTARAAERMAEAQAEASGIDAGDLVGPLQERLQPALWDLRELTDTVTYAADVVEVLPAALGADGPRRYLLLFQNNAEFRATGGLPGAFAILEARNGRLTLGDQGSTGELQGPDRLRPEEVMDFTEEEQSLFQGKLDDYVQDSNMTPDWPRTGEIASTVWEAHSGDSIDGVLSVDPGALSKVLAGTGQVQLPDGRQAGPQTITKMLLNDPYLQIEDNEAQNEYFAASARVIFDALMSGQGDPAKAASGLFDAAREQRVLVWFADEEEQAAIEEGTAAGRITREPGWRPQVGVFFNDATATKLDYYVTSSTDVEREECYPNGGQRLRITTTMRSDVPEDAASLPPTLLGQAPKVGEPGDLLVNVLGYGTAGGTIHDPTLDGERGSPNLQEHLGHPVVTRTVLLEPGQEVTLSYVVDTAPRQSGAPRLRTTPTARGSSLGTVEQDPCS